jgi:hypothetical protein
VGHDLSTYRKVETVSSWLGPEHMGKLGEVRCTADSETLWKTHKQACLGRYSEFFLTSNSSAVVILSFATQRR